MRGIIGIIRNIWFTPKRGHQELFSWLKKLKKQIYRLNEKVKKIDLAPGVDTPSYATALV